MMTYWLKGRTDMSQANDSMVCKFKPRKKKKKPPKKLDVPDGKSELGASHVTLGASSVNLGGSSVNIEGKQSEGDSEKTEKVQGQGEENEIIKEKGGKSGQPVEGSHKMDEKSEILGGKSEKPQEQTGGSVGAKTGNGKEETSGEAMAKSDGVGQKGKPESKDKEKTDNLNSEEAAKTDKSKTIPEGTVTKNDISPQDTNNKYSGKNHDKNNINQSLHESPKGEDSKAKNHILGSNSLVDTPTKGVFETIIEMEEPKPHNETKMAATEVTASNTIRQNGVVPAQSTGRPEGSIPGTVEGATPPTKRLAMASGSGVQKA